MKDKTQHPMQEKAVSNRISYLLRLWQTPGSGGFNWRASLENPSTGRRIGFANLERLFAYLMDVAESGVSENER